MVKKKKSTKKASKKSAKKAKPLSKESKVFIGITAILVIIAVFMGLQSTQQQSVSDSPVIAVVNGEKITQEFVDTERELFYFATGSPGTAETLEQGILINQSISQILLLSEAERQGISVPREEIESQLQESFESGVMNREEFDTLVAEAGFTYDDIIDFSQKQATILQLLNDTVFTLLSVSDEEAQKYYTQNEAQFTQSQQVRASHILVSTQEELDAVVAQLNAGADFATLATEKSIDPSAQQNGGDLGYFGQGQMVPEFEQKAFSLSVGEMGTVQTQFGFHVVKVEDRQNGEKVSFDQVKDQLKQGLLLQKQRESAEQVLTLLWNNADVEFK